MKRKVLKSLVIGFVSLLAMGVVSACGESRTPNQSEAVALSAPTNVQADFWKLTWDEVENASGYVVSFDGEEYQTEEPSFGLFEYVSPSEGIVLDVKAKGDGKAYADSDWVTVDYEAEPVTENLRYSRLSDGTYEVYCLVDDVPADGKIVYPDKYNGRIISSVGHERSFGAGMIPYDSVKAVRLPAELKLFGGGCYQSKIEEIFIPDSVERIAGLTFYQCIYLSKVKLPKNLKEIMGSAFNGCVSLEEIELPQGLQLIESKAFAYTGIREFNLPESLVQLVGGTEIGAFYGSRWYAKQPDGVLYCGQFLYGYKGEIPVDTVLTDLQPKKAVACCAFDQYSISKQHVTNENCKNLKGIVLPEGYQTIGAGAFRDCKAFSEVVLPEGLISIGDRAFERTVLESVRLPDTLLTIGSHAFSETNLTEVKLSKNLITIDEAAFSGTKLTEIELPDSLTTIGRSAFANTALTEIELPDSLTTIGIGAFANTALREINIPKNVTKIENNTFLSNANLTTVILPSNIKTLYIGAFSECYGLNLVIPAEIEEVIRDKAWTGGATDISGNVIDPIEGIEERYEGVKIFYLGDETGWEKAGNEYFHEYFDEWLPVYYYSEDPPQESGKYWRYVDGVPTVWE